MTAQLDLFHWFHGSQFSVENSKACLPKDVTLPFGTINLEERSANVVVAAFGSVEQEALVKIIDCRRYGSLNKLLRVTGYVLRFKANILAKLRNKLNDFKIGKLTVTEIEECKALWVLHDQKFVIGKDNFTKVKNSLNLFCDDKKISRLKTRISDQKFIIGKDNFTKVKNSLNLFCGDKKILRVKKRISFSFDKKFPILLKKDIYFTEFFVLNAHAAVSTVVFIVLSIIVALFIRLLRGG